MQDHHLVQISTTIHTCRIRFATQEEKEAEAGTAQKPRELSLWLPSQIKTKVPFDRRLAEIEWKLCLAQAHEALDSL